MTTLRPAVLAGSSLFPVPASGAQLLGFGAAQPGRTITAAQLGEPFGRSADWVQARTGIGELRRIGVGEDLLDLAAAAADQALGYAGVGADQVDFIIAATCSSRDGRSGQGPHLAARIAPGAAFVDLNAVCSGFCYAVSTAQGMISTGSARHVLIVAAEHMSDLIDPEDLGTGIIFGDGAGAAVLGPLSDGDPRIGPVVWGSDGSQRDLIEFTDDGPYMRMQGRQVFRWAVENVPVIAARACERAGVSPRDIEVFVPHQANLRIVDAVATRLGLSDVIVADDVTGSGNTSSASIPIAMTRLLESGQVRPGQLALLVGFGAGLAYAAQVMRIP